jgi:hypothetical protein
MIGKLYGALMLFSFFPPPPPPPFQMQNGRTRKLHTLLKLLNALLRLVTLMGCGGTPKNTHTLTFWSSAKDSGTRWCVCVCANASDYFMRHSRPALFLFPIRSCRRILLQALYPPTIVIIVMYAAAALTD